MHPEETVLDPDLPGSEKQLTPKLRGAWAHADASSSLKATAKLDLYKQRMAARAQEGGTRLLAAKLDWMPAVAVAQKEARERAAAARGQRRDERRETRER